jgi:hypothetical protein
MKSPFPGLDPYLEQHWCDVHSTLVVYARDRLQPRLPGSLRARVEERVFLETDEDSYRVIYPDVHVFEQSQSREPSLATAAGTDVAVQKPLLVQIEDESVRQGFIEIVDAASGNRVVTIIEFLSPSNKMPGEGRRLYLRKLREVARAGASLVEIDLTREGRRALMLPTSRIPRSHRTTYQACVRRCWKPSAYEIYRAPLRQPLPSIRIPLRQTDADVPLELQAVVDQCYENGRYDSLDYSVPPEPPLDPPDAAWADELLRAAGRRQP